MDYNLQKIWQLQKNDLSLRDELVSNLGVSVYLAQILLNRDIKEVSQAEEFLNPSLNKLTNPNVLIDIDKAVARIELAIKRSEKIIVYGDYDVDGVTSAVILHDYLTKKHAKAEIYIPHRHNEGYGLNIEAIKEIVNKGFSLLITVDCGTNNLEEISFANSQGLEVIVTDHHQPGSKLPPSLALINPNTQDDCQKLKVLAGVGVVFKLIQALEKGKTPVQYLDLVTLGTVADIVPLRGENRILVTEGLKNFNHSKCPGLLALIQISGLRDKKITTGQIGYGLAPRINASGRIDDSIDAIQLLQAKTLEEALPLAIKLDKKNKQRQQYENKVLDEALAKIEKEVKLEEDKAIVLYDQNWNPGVIGIVASRLVEMFYRPVILLTKKDCFIKGSGRSIESFHLLRAITQLSNLLEKFGGHHHAIGLSLSEDDFFDFRKRFLEIAAKEISNEDLKPKIDIDLILDQSEISKELTKEIEMLSPFGSGNPAPVFAVKKANYEKLRKVGRGNHLKFNLPTFNGNFEAIGFNYGCFNQQLQNKKAYLDFAFNLESNYFRGEPRCQLKLIDLKINEVNKEQDSFIEALFDNYQETNEITSEKGALSEGAEAGNKNNNIICNFKEHTNELIIKRPSKFENNKFKPRQNLKIIDKRNINSKEIYLKSSLLCGGKSVIYLNNQDKCVELAMLLRKVVYSGLNEIAFYHQGLTENERIEIIKRFENAQLRCLVSTIIFVNDLNLPNIRNVYFYHLPLNFDSFYYLCNKIGLDNQQAFIHLLFGEDDKYMNEYILEAIAPSRQSLKKIYNALRAISDDSGNIKASKKDVLSRLIEDYNYSYHQNSIDGGLNILKDVNLIKIKKNKNFDEIYLSPQSDKKVDLNKSNLFKDGEKMKEDFLKFYQWILNTDSNEISNVLKNQINPH